MYFITIRANRRQFAYNELWIKEMNIKIYNNTIYNSESGING